MIKVIGGYLTGEQETEIDGKKIHWDNIVLSLVTDNIPDSYKEKNYFGLKAEMLKCPRKDVRFDGFDKIDELLNKNIDIIYSVFNGKPKVDRIVLLPATK